MSFTLADKTVFITGGSGTWGQEFTRQLAETRNVREIRIYSRGEYRQVEMRRALQRYPNVRYIVGDVRDRERLYMTLHNVNVVIHLAALKHVPVVEEHPREALLTNTTGTMNVVDAAIEKGVERVLFVSSDKAVDPLSFYGITKLAAERLVVAASEENHSSTRLIVYRAGNVMGSAGSVIPIFQKQLTQHNSITLTDPTMTRFFLSCHEAVGRALTSLEEGHGSETFVPKMKAATLEMLSAVMIKRLGNAETKVDRISVRPGEKHSELLISRNEAPRTVDLNCERWVILPPFCSNGLVACYSRAPRVPFAQYGSDTALRFTAEELEDLLHTEGFLSPVPAHADGQPYFRKGEWEFV